MPRVFIIHKNGRPASKTFDDAFEGFTDRNYEVIPFEASQVYSLKSTKEDVHCAGIAFMGILWKELGIKPPPLINIPPELLPYAKRKIWQEPFNDVLKRFLTGAPPPVFIKPAKTEKLFTGLVVNSLRDLLYVKDIAEDTTVECQEVIDIVVEYRCYCNFYKTMIDCNRYGDGDFRVFPDLSVVDNIIKDFQNPPVAYSVDVGVLKTGETVLIEINDSYCLGSYGINAISYSKMLSNRWMEIACIPQNIEYT
jgi:hypothetical protein